MTLDIQLRGEQLTLHPSGALYRAATNTLLLSDVHIGKVTHFRKHGIAVPLGAAAANFEQLDAVADYFRPEHICFLGDLFHSRMNSEWELFASWTAGRSEHITLISGNHDILSPERYAALGITVLESWSDGPFLFLHHPATQEDAFTICGHVHPGVRLYGSGRQLLTLPCFFQTEHQLILPAFGAFTGKHILRPGEGDRVYVVTKERVMEVKGEG